MEFEANLGGNLSQKAREDTEALRELKGSLGAAGDALKKLHDEAGKASPPAVIPAPVDASETPKRGRGRPRKEVDPNAPAKPKKEAKPETAVGVETADFTFLKATKAAADVAALKGKQKATEDYYKKVRALETGAAKNSDALRLTTTSKDKAASTEAMTIAKGAALAGAAALGVAGVGSIAKLALGYRGMFALQGISYRLGLSFRALFSGVNPAPVLRAATMFADQFKKTSVLGSALEGIFSRAFNGLFSGVERATPYVIAFVQGITIGFLTAENYILRARIALAPFSGMLDGVVSSATGLETAATLGGLALVALGAKAAIGLAPLLPYAAAIAGITAALTQAIALSKEWDEQSGGQILAQLKQDLGGEKVKPKGLTTGADYDAMMAAKAKASPAAAAAGVETGTQLAAGIVKGMSASEAAVAAGGGKLALAANAGVRAEAKIKSPSRLMEGNARYMGAGIEVGLAKSRAGIQAAAERNLVPDLGGAGVGGRGASSRGGSAVKVEINGPLVHVVSSGVADLEALVLSLEPRIRDAVMRGIALALGVSVEA